MVAMKAASWAGHLAALLVAWRAVQKVDSTEDCWVVSTAAWRAAHWAVRKAALTVDYSAAYWAVCSAES